MNNIFKEKLEMMPDLEAFKAKLAFVVSVALLVISTTVISARQILAPMDGNLLYSTIMLSVLMVPSLYLTVVYPNRRAGRVLLLGAIHWQACVGAQFNGGINSPIFAVSMLVPVLSALLVNKKGALFWVVLSLITLFTYYNLGLSGKLSSPQLTDPQLISTARLLIYSAVIILCGVIGYGYDDGRAQADLDMREIQDAHISGIARLNSKYRIIYSNFRFKELFGGNDIGKHIDEIDIENSLNRPQFSEFIANKHLNSPLEIEVNDGVWYEFVWSTTRRGNRILHITNRTNEHQRRKLESRLAESEALKAWIVTLNHEINNPLAIVCALVEIMQRNGNGDANRIDKINVALGRVRHVVKEISTIGGIGTDVQIPKEDYSINTSMIKLR